MLTRDVDASKEFYRQLRDWTMEDMPIQSDSYTILKTEGRLVGNIMKMPLHVPPDAPNYLVSYIRVYYVDSAAKKTQQLGAKIRVPPIDSPDARFCVFEDPQGAVLSIIHYSKKSNKRVYRWVILN